MTAQTRKLALVASASAAILCLTGGGISSASAAIIPGDCAGMKIPTNSTAGNQAPVATDDTATAVAGGTAYIKPLANDTDPDGNRIALVNAATPAKGEVCIDSTGTLEYTAAASQSDYVAKFRYGITDGDFYRTAVITVSVEGVKSMRAQLLHKLVKRNGHVQHPARIEFTNPNHRAMLVLVGSPKRDKPTVARGLGVGHSLVFNSRDKRLSFLIGVSTGNGEIALVNLGALNTVTGRQQIVSISSLDPSAFSAGSGSAPRWASTKAMAQHWMRVAAQH